MTRRVDALGDLLAQDRRGDERDALDRAGHVAQGVELLSAGATSRGLADHAARRPAAAPRGTRPRRRPTRKPGIASSLSSVPPVWPRPRPDIIGTITPHAAASGARIERGLVADAAGAVLVDLRAGHVGQVERVAGVRPSRAVRSAVSAGGHAAQDDGHEQGGELVVGPGAVGGGPDERLDLVAGQRAAVAFRG